MGLPVRQRRVLGRIDRTLRVSDPRLIALFAIFSRLAQGEEMPRLEQLRHGVAARMARLRAGLRALGTRLRPRARPRPRFRFRIRARQRAVILYPLAIALAIGAIVFAAMSGSDKGCQHVRTVAARNLTRPGLAARPGACRAPGSLTPLMTGR